MAGARPHADRGHVEPARPAAHEREFDAAVDQLRSLADSGLVWADCEALERRHQIGRGSLVVLDWIPESGSPTYEERREFLAKLVEIDALKGRPDP